MLRMTRCLPELESGKVEVEACGEKTIRIISGLI
jgi:hypothetical protein